MMEETTLVTAAAVVLGLLAREIISYLRSRKNGNPGNPHTVLECPNQPSLEPMTTKLDRIAEILEDVKNIERENSETLTKIARGLDDLQHSGDKTKQALADQQEILEYLRKSERQRE